MKWINRLYIFFVGIILAITTGFGIAAFYPEPVRPQYPQQSLNSIVPRSCYETPQENQSEKCQQLIAQSKTQTEIETQKYDQDLATYNARNAGYTRTAIFFGVAMGAFFAVAGIAFIKSSRLVANGLLLASVLTAVSARLLIHLASLGSPVTSTQQGNATAYAEFVILAILSVAIIFIGQFSLREHSSQAAQ